MRRVLAAALGLMLSFGAASSPAEEIKITRENARLIAQKAFQARNYVLARQMALILLQVDPKDPTALVVLAASEPFLGRADEGRKAGKLAWKSTDSPVLKHEAAFYTARAELLEKNYGQAKFWLRRAYQSAKTPQQQQAVARGFQQLRAISPWQTALSFSVAPSNNLNGGSQSRFLEIDDFFAIGALSGDARALSGSVTVAEASGTYRLSRSASHETSITLRGYQDFKRLSSDAKAQAPGVTGSDFDFGLAELSLTHRIAAKGRPLPDTFGIKLGQSWHAYDKLEHYAGVEIGRSFALPGGIHARLRADATRRWSDRGAPETESTSLGVQLYKTFGNGNTLSFGLTGRENNSISVFQDYSGWDATLGLTLGKPIGPATLSGNIGIAVSDYQRYHVAFFAIPGGRQDRTAKAELNMQFKEFDYMGFHPVVTLHGQKTVSNISRFETRTYGISLGLRSNF
ncbi:MAG: hypothetical protein ACWA47_05165 [Brevirhabdus sp.]